MKRGTDKKTIELAHGSGGRDSADLIKDVFGKHFSNEVLDSLEDGAVLDMKETKGDGSCVLSSPSPYVSKIVMSTDSFVVTPLTFPGGDIGKLSICGTVNDILMMGAIPRYLTCGFIIEEGFDIETLDKIVVSAAGEADKAGVKVVAGDTKVIDRRGDEPGLFINTTGIGILPEGRNVSAANSLAGDMVIVTGDLGDHHACILSARMNIENNIKSDCALLKEITDSLFADKVNVHTMRDITRGGLGTVLNEIASASNVSVEIIEKDLPVNGSVRDFCGIMGLDPIYMGNEGKMVIIVDPEDADNALKAIKKTGLGKDARLIGCVKEGGTKTGSGVFLKTKIGGTRKIDMLYGEGLPRIC